MHDMLPGKTGPQRRRGKKIKKKKGRNKMKQKKNVKKKKVKRYIERWQSSRLGCARTLLTTSWQFSS
jgi:hypothetical protein